MNVQDINLDIDKRLSPSSVIRIGQGDKSGTTIRAHIYDNGVAASLSGMSARFNMQLPNTTHYVRDTNCTVNGNVITYVMDEEHAASVAGTTDVAYFDVLQGSSVIYSTGRFSIDVLRSVIDGATPSEGWDSAIDEAIDNANEAADEARAAAGGTIPLMASNMRGGAKLGDGLAISSEVLSVAPLTTAQIDTVANDGSLTSNNVLNGTRLTYLWGKLRTAFASLVDGVVAVSQGGTGLAASPSMRVNLSSHDAADVLQASPKPGIEGMLPVAYGGSGQGGVRAESVIGDIATAGEGCTIDSARYLRWGEVAQLFLVITCDSAKDADAVVANIVGGKRPIYTIALMNSTEPQHSCTAYNNGEIKVKSAVTAGTVIYVSGTYLVS